MSQAGALSPCTPWRRCKGQTGEWGGAQTVYVLHSTPEGDIQTELPSQVTPLPAK